MLAALPTSLEARPGAGVSALIFNVMRFATHDGSGIRTTVFFKGCPLACWWCHNPEGQSFQPERFYFEERCRKCLDCAAVCPQHAIREVDGRITTSALCDCCGRCTQACMAEARQIAGRRYTVGELIAEVEKDAVFFDESGGGVTLSGGEPMAHPAFVAAFLCACRERGIRSVIETCGFAQTDTFVQTALLADEILLDLKLVDPERHLRYTGVANDVILRNARSLAARHRAVAVRIPVVPGINDSDADMAQFAACLAGLRPVRVELLPYHRIGTDKYRRLGAAYKLADTPQPTPAGMARFRQVLTQAGLHVTIGG